MSSEEVGGFLEGTETASLEAGEGDTVRLLAGSNGGGSGSRQCWGRLFAAEGPESRGLQSKRGPRGSVPFGGVALPARTPRAEGVAAPAPVRAVATVRRLGRPQGLPGTGEKGVVLGGRRQRGGVTLARAEIAVPGAGRRLSRAKADAFSRAQLKLPGEPAAPPPAEPGPERSERPPPTALGAAGAQVAAGARRAQLARLDGPQRRDALIGGGGAGSGGQGWPGAAACCRGEAARLCGERREARGRGGGRGAVV